MQVADPARVSAGREFFAFPISFAQRRLWFLDRLNPGNPFYNIHAAVPIHAAVDRRALQQTIHEMVRRHETLRTTFGIIDDEPVQLVAPALTIPIRHIDLTEVPSVDQDKRVMELAVGESRRPFYLAEGPLLRVGLIEKSPIEYVLLITLHHIIADGWSMNVFSKELTTLYGAYAAFKTSPLPELSIQYADFAIWQREWLQGQVLEDLLDYWRDRLENISPLSLPTDRPRPRIATYQGSTCAVEIGPSLTRRLTAIGKAHDCTLFMTMLAGFKALLVHYLRQTDIVIGSPIANRNRSELEPLIGFFVNSLVFRTSLEGNPSFIEIMGRVRETALGAYANQDLPFEMLVDSLHTDRDLSRNPLFQVSFQLLHVSDNNDGTHNLAVERGAAIFDLAVNLWESRGKVTGFIEYSSDLFDADSIIRLIKHYKALLQSVCDDPGQKLTDIDFTPADEFEQLTRTWNNTGSPLPPFEPAHRMFEAVARSQPDRLAIRDGSRGISYSELDRKATRLAAWLMECHGLESGGYVPICLPRSIDLVTAILAVLKSGNAYIPIDPAYPGNRIQHMLDESGADLVLTSAAVRDAVDLGQVQAIDCSEALGISEAILNRVRFPEAQPEDSVYVIYTSGSTGRPKGVEISHAALNNLIHWHRTAFGVEPEDHATLVASPAFDASVWEIWPYLTAGSSLYIVNDALRDDPPRLINWLKTEAITISFLPTPIAEIVLKEYWPADSTLRFLLTGGDRLHYQAPREMPFVLVNNYGPTENTVVTTSGEVVFNPGSRKNPPIGRPITNTTVYLLGPNGKPVPIGVPGEIHIGGAGLAKGYLRQPALTGEAFVPNPFDPSGQSRLYKTGDLGRYLPDGQIEFLGRLDHQVNIRGIRTELGEIETVLAQQPEVAECAVGLHEPEVNGGTLVAWVVPESRSPEAAGESSVVEYVEHWRSIYEGVYREDRTETESAFNFAGWNSSYTGKPIPADEMRQWADFTTGKILAFRPQSVLEVGCGTGLMLFRIAPGVRHYTGVDFSEAALEFVTDRLDAGTRDRVSLICSTADRLEMLGDQRFDTILLNSVVQYFPSVEYLVDVLEVLLDRVEPGGRIFVGDVRNLGLMDAFHHAVERFRSAPDTRLKTLSQRARKLAELDRELLIHPEFFTAFQKRHPRISSVRIECKRGKAQNELLQFRYDVTLETGRTAASPAVSWTSWSAGQYNLERLRAELSGGELDRIHLKDIPNRRVYRDVQFLESALSADDNETLQSVRMPDNGAVDPEALIELAESLGYRAELGWLASNPAGQKFQYLDGQFVRKDRDPLPLQALPNRDMKPFQQYGNQPLRARWKEDLRPKLVRSLKDHLPEAMVPSQFVFMDALPLTTNGKLDRKRLPAPERSLDKLKHMGRPPGTAAEKAFAAIWEGLLNVENVSIDDNFFELGGDSILSIQIVARANKAGYRISPTDLFQRQTIAELAAAAKEETVSEIDQGPVTGEFPLTPIGCWFFERNYQVPSHFNQAVLLNMGFAVESDALEAALGHLLRHHDVLRMRFVTGDGHDGIRASIPDTDEDFRLLRAGIDASGEEDLGRIITERSTEIQSSLDLENGPLLRACLFDAGPVHGQFLLLAVHHLAIDGVSWRILLEDLDTGYRQVRQAEPVELPLKTTSFPEWAGKLQAYARSGISSAVVEYWKTLCTRLADQSVKEIFDDPDGNNGIADEAELEVALSHDETQRLLTRVHVTYNTRINDILLVSLMDAWEGWTGSTQLHIDLEGHGREPVIRDVDLSRTIGWFTTLYPAFLDWGGVPDTGSRIKLAKEYLRAVPHGGMSYGLLRYLGEDAVTGQQLAAIPDAPIAFNYLGQWSTWNGDQEANSLAVPDRRWTGLAKSPLNERDHPIEINAWVTGGRFSMLITYSRRQFREATIQRLAEEWLRAIRGILEHCFETDAGGYTPSDFSGPDLGQEELDRLVSNLGKPRRRRKRKPSNSS